MEDIREVYERSSFLAKAYNPFHVSGVVAGVSALVMLGGKLFFLMGWLGVSQSFPWLTAASFVLVYAIFNSVFTLSSKNLDRYMGRSILAFLALVLVSGVLARLISGMPMDEAGTYKWIFFVLSFCYLVFISIMGLVKRIVAYAQREEWNQPRLRYRKPRRKI